MSRVYIKGWTDKPKSCTDCPMCNEYDDCDLLPEWYKEWDDQYANCPLVEEDDDE